MKPFLGVETTYQYLFHGYQIIFNIDNLIKFLRLSNVYIFYSRLFKNVDPLMTVLDTLEYKFLDTLENPGVIGAAILTITDLLTNIGVQGRLSVLRT